MCPRKELDRRHPLPWFIMTVQAGQCVLIVVLPCILLHQHALRNLHSHQTEPWSSLAPTTLIPQAPPHQHYTLQETTGNLQAMTVVV